MKTLPSIEQPQKDRRQPPCFIAPFGSLSWGPAGLHFRSPRLVAATTTSMDLALCLHYPGWRGRVLWSIALPSPAAFPLWQEGSAPARNYRGLLRVHLPFGMRICTLVAPRNSPEASVGDLSPQLLLWLPGCIDNSPDGTCTRWISRPRRSLRKLTSAHIRSPFVPHCHVPVETP